MLVIKVLSHQTSRDIDNPLRVDSALESTKWHPNSWTAHRKRMDGNSVSKVAINLLMPTGYVMHQQFNIQQLYALPTLYLCVLYLSENKQRLVPLTA